MEKELGTIEKTPDEADRLATIRTRIRELTEQNNRDFRQTLPELDKELELLDKQRDQLKINYNTKIQQYRDSVMEIEVPQSPDYGPSSSVEARKGSAPLSPIYASTSYEAGEVGGDAGTIKLQELQNQQSQLIKTAHNNQLYNTPSLLSQSSSSHSRINLDEF